VYVCVCVCVSTISRLVYQTGITGMYTEIKKNKNYYYYYNRFTAPLDFVQDIPG